MYIYCKPRTTWPPGLVFSVSGYGIGGLGLIPRLAPISHCVVSSSFLAFLRWLILLVIQNYLKINLEQTEFREKNQFLFYFNNCLYRVMWLLFRGYLHNVMTTRYITLSAGTSNALTISVTFTKHALKAKKSHLKDHMINRILHSW